MDSCAQACFSFTEGGPTALGFLRRKAETQQHCLAAHVPGHQGLHDMLTLNTSLSPFQVMKAGIQAGTLPVEERSSLRKSRPVWEVR